MNNLTYSMQGDYCLPNLLPPQEEEVTLGKFALLRRSFLKQNRRVTYTNLLTSGKLTEHLLEIQRTAQEQLEKLTQQMAKSQGVTEQMKSENQMLWVQVMNNLRQSAEEIVMKEVIYS